MEIAFNNIAEHITPMEVFSLQWRFTEENYNVLPQHDLDELKTIR